MYFQGESYEILESLGEGGYSKVYSAFGHDKKVGTNTMTSHKKNFNQNPYLVNISSKTKSEEDPLNTEIEINFYNKSFNINSAFIYCSVQLIPIQKKIK